MANASNATPAVIAARIVDAVGGPANITSLTHCATRLHFELADAGHVNQHGLESIPGVLGAFPRAGNRYQVIIGGAVASVYEQIVRLRTARLMPAAQLPSAVMQSASQSTQPTQSMQPTQPAQPAQSAQSTQPTQPAQSAPYLSDDAAPSRDTATDAEQSCGPSNTSRHFTPRTVREWGSAARARAAAFFDYLSDSFRPILGVLLGASLVIAIVNVIVALGIVPDGETSTGWILLKAIWEGVFTVLPIMIAYNAAKKLDVDPWLGGAIMAALMTPQLTGVMSGMSGTSVSSALSGEIQCSATATFGTETCTVSAFGIPIQLNDYSGNIFVPLLMAAVLAVVYRGLKRVIPDSVQLVFVPFLSLVVVFALTILVIGPLGIWLGSGLGAATAWLNAHVPFLFALIIPMLYPFLVPLGLHWPLNALILMNIQTLGYDFVQGPMGVWNFACFGATAGVLVLAVRGKDSAMRQTAVGALLAGLLGGVSELSLYGIHLHHRRVYRWLLAGCAAGGVTSAVFGWLFPSVLPSGQMVRGVTTTAFAFSSLLTIPVFDRMWVYALSIAVAFVMAMVLTVLFGYRTPSRATEAQMVSAGENARSQDAVRGIGTTSSDAESAEDSPSRPASDRALDSNAILSPVAGRLVNLEATGDPVFASRALGEGVGVVPETTGETAVLAPVSGMLKTVARTGHAFGIKTDGGIEVLVHIGIDTVDMDGEGFAVVVAKGERIAAGEPLATVDFGKVAAAGHSVVVVVTVVNAAELTVVTPLIGDGSGDNNGGDCKTVSAGSPIIDVEQ
ncbi:MAG: glucose PTS transporter subunit IIA [Bifidobacterium longum]|uniref:glucose PTS transporter subunit IIA n=1 Tax=Bifidobacterium longum TaxID=216816 RepID=UPI0002F98018|nr:glucose PTS transporter subunit IIA [Bifidobacterium longum]KSA09227.1 PTS sugar transporter subunit IIC [Bifidobacterium longum subsp. longum]KSA09999.1 PTS sugar transporter subunit IIC [Bifidobacterium longum subsp. longum]MDB6654295.1 glucose PTS transporter subunit IIA [Bifidobacterium longum]MDB6656390.1 glucose PTS transporter subunit IIA [Bifidobacterium longum]MDB6663735.1 glucose PTS transporter subunit IIA [Bifidobacterium longum]